ncbi:hypothetical protein CHLRE_09g408550v5 [Chlamydomonas reinhardtii]|uniref:THIF-type NAD/FAD binding fold domain-containing protein n=1 Tax=Chlamydomonas reinhardtii TaxID=3055 RepID=A0A2K3DFH6_CHLRE|nr:uncharacterized protein CHLRE_09g408550v5 [Chlamydomonas reinhardtii]PNW79267.1 hypothetical protein CHLRE_09g408550v5 [Chlamydomonas reinhardtii]
MAPAVDTLTEDHAAVYDRQLRVWGVEVQRRLMEAKVLVLGLGGLAAEVSKNLVLAGVGRVGLRDDTPAAAAAPGNFLVDPSAAAEGLTVAEACARTLQAMNPLMAVAVEPGPPHAAALLPAQHPHHTRHGHSHPGESEAEALRALLSRYDLVVAVGGGAAGGGLALEQVAALDGAARALGVGVFAGAARGPSSWVFVDLGGECEQGFGYTPKGETEQRWLRYASFRSALTGGLGGVHRRTHPLYLVLRACWQFEEEHGRPPAGAADAPAVRAAFDRLTAATPAAPPLPADLLEAFVIDGAAPSAAAAAGADVAAASAAAAGLEQDAAAAAAAAGSEQEEPQGELAPVCAVVGGVVANNVLRALSAANPPLRNFFFYSYLVRDGLGLEECFM